MAKTPAKPDANAFRIFLVDDHPVLRQGLGRLIDDQPDMKMCGEAESPPDAMRLLATAKADVAIVDLTLRGGDGLELCKQIRERWKDLPSWSSPCTMSRFTRSAPSKPAPGVT
jgi:DNA-binding NarL/FixJ family response regulator